MADYNMRIELDLPRGLDQSSKVEVAEAMDAELGRFQQWFMGQGNEALMKMERSILKTYLAWKLLHDREAECAPATSP